MHLVTNTDYILWIQEKKKSGAFNKCVEKGFFFTSLQRHTSKKLSF